MKISLRKRTNTLFVKIDDGISEWGFSVRIIDFEDTLEYKLPAR